MQAFAARPFTQVQRVLRIEAMSYDAARMFARSLLEPTNAAREKLMADFKAHDAKFQAILKDYTDGIPADERSRVQALRDDWAKLSEATTKGLEFAVLNGKQHGQRHRDRRTAHRLRGCDGPPRGHQGPLRPVGRGSRPCSPPSRSSSSASAVRSSARS